ncbi:hypothetical protein LWI28_000508 [Acer negundo]|uniref:SMP domain-containing protein n=1 Tax=Acer negundo TaxID=4023 RepID=A0AAD5NVD4_ACENE|nr:hypothetical protein LWI28_000508 [Acer negundo]
MIRLLAEGVTGAEMRNDPGAAAKLPTDKQATGRDAEGVTGTKMRNDPMLTTHLSGVAASVVAVARLNQQKNDRVALCFSS